MTKSDLKTGMRITFNGGMTALVMKGTEKGDILWYENYEWDTLNTVKEDLTTDYVDEGTREIIKVQRFQTNKNKVDWEVLWKRNNVIELTLAQIAEKLDIPVNELRIKE